MDAQGSWIQAGDWWIDLDKVIAVERSSLMHRGIMGQHASEPLATMYLATPDGESGPLSVTAKGDQAHRIYDAMDLIVHRRQLEIRRAKTEALGAVVVGDDVMEFQPPARSAGPMPERKAI